ncbi:methylitaconate delta2-delta3-isomerase [Seiridium cupressi]
MDRSFPALFVRGGTSNGLVIRRQDLPPQDEWHTVLPAAMGSPDPYGRQLNGMGSGISSTSKICVVSPSSRPDADVDFTFVQVGIKDGTLDMAGNCGNMSSAIGPMAWNEGLVEEKETKILKQENEHGHREALVRFFNTNTSKVVHSRFRVTGSPPQYCPEGEYEMEGMPGTQSRITLSFLDPAGAKTGKALPTGNAVDTLKLLDGAEIRASLVDVSNPGVFIKLEDLGLNLSRSAALADTFTPQYVEADVKLKAHLEEIRRVGASMMGLDPKIESVPKIVILFPKAGSQDVDIRCLALSMGQAHKAVPLTLALCLGAAANISGTLAHELLHHRGGEKSSVTIGHPSGRVEVGTTLQDGKVISAELHRTARLLMKGDVYY